ncbi:MAG: LON peptidase substrate-binding domain-containing protein [Saccharospirillum sp.]|uniref:LON peptidase substrate-binding domain-containing protein n=1 Tax=Saccharospirillum sp. TaxID=2033801 RepID=UPI00329A6814
MTQFEPDSTTARYPLFPMGALLLPDASLPLQIFEPRYLMMVSSSTRDNRPFVIMLSEPGKDRSGHGCLARIVDFNQQANGLLGITIVGEQRVRVSAAAKDVTGLWWGGCEASDEPLADPELEMRAALRYQPLLDALLEHPYLADQVGLQLDSARGSVHQLMVWLPLESELKRRLLVEDSFLQRCALLESALAELSGSPDSPGDRDA